MLYHLHEVKVKVGKEKKKWIIRLLLTYLKGKNYVKFLHLSH